MRQQRPPYVAKAERQSARDTPPFSEFQLCTESPPFNSKFKEARTPSALADSVDRNVQKRDFPPSTLPCTSGEAGCEKRNARATGTRNRCSSIAYRNVR